MPAERAVQDGCAFPLRDIIAAAYRVKRYQISGRKVRRKELTVACDRRFGGLRTIVRARGAQFCDGNAAADAIELESTEFNALPEAVEQLGLKLESRRMPIDTLVVQEVQRTPTEK